MEGGWVAVLARGSNAAPLRTMCEGDRPSLHRPSTQGLSSSIQDGFEDGALPHGEARPASSRPQQPREPRRGSMRLSGSRWRPVGCTGQKKGKGWRKQGGWRVYASCEATGAGSRLLTPNESCGGASNSRNPGPPLRPARKSRSRQPLLSSQSRLWQNQRLCPGGVSASAPSSQGGGGSLPQLSLENLRRKPRLRGEVAAPGAAP